MFGSIGMPELIIIFVIALIIFGPRKLPELGKSLGRSLNEFKKASNDLQNTLEQEIRLEEQKEKEAAERLRREGRKFLGERRVLTQDPYDSPTSWEKRRGLRPTFASRDKWKRIQLIALLEGFYARYREALAAWRKGDREVVFPFGTYWMRVFHGARCELAPAPS